MYSQDFSNNPFLAAPSSTHTRYPDIGTIEAAGPSSPSVGAPYGQSGFGSQGYGYEAQMAQVQQYGQQQQPYAPGQQQAYAGAAWGAAQPSMNGAGMAYGVPMSPRASYASQPYQQPQQQQGYQQPQYPGGYAPAMAMQSVATGYPGGYAQQLQQQQQQQQQQAGYLSEFDPYGNLAQLQASPGAITSTSTSSTRSTPAISAATAGGRQHPREFIQVHRDALGRWDQNTWKQAISAFDELRAAWESYKEMLGAQLRQNGYYMSPQDNVQLQSMQKEADQHIDTIAAASVQMQEVLSGYRHSGDRTSKERVRQSLNAAIQVLPNWPQN